MKRSKNFTGKIFDRRVFNPQVFSETKKKAEAIIRWAPFLVNKEQVPFDGNVDNHQKNQSVIVKKYGKLDIGYEFNGHTITKEDIFQVRVLAKIHDFGECSDDTGDENGAIKDSSTSSENTIRVEKETKVFTEIVNKLIERESNIKDYLFQTYKIDNDENHHLHDYFKVHEVLSYLTGAFFTFNNKKEVKYHQELYFHVIAKQLPKILTQAEEGLPSCVEFLKDYATIIDEIFSESNDIEMEEVFEKTAKLIYEDNKNQANVFKEFLLENFPIAKTSWEEYKRSKNLG